VFIAHGSGRTHEEQPHQRAVRRACRPGAGHPHGAVVRLARHQTFGVRRGRIASNECPPRRVAHVTRHATERKRDAPLERERHAGGIATRGSTQEEHRARLGLRGLGEVSLPARAAQHGNGQQGNAKGSH